MPRPFDFKSVKATPRRPSPVSAYRAGSRSRRVTRLRSRGSVPPRPVTVRRPLRSPQSASQGGVPLFSSLVMMLIVILGLVGFVVWSGLRLLPAVLPMPRDTQLGLVTTGSAGQRKVMVLSLTTVDHRFQVVDLAGSTVTTQLTTLEKLATASSEIQRATLSWWLGTPLDTVVWETQQSSSELSTLPEWREWWWQFARQPFTTGVPTATRWSGWVFVRDVDQGQFAYNQVTDFNAWLQQRPKLRRASAFTQCSVAVLNTTPRSGLATQVATLLEQSRFSVVKVGDQAPPLDTSTITVAGDDPECSAEAQALAGILPSRVEIVSNPTITDQYRAQIVIMIGEDVAAIVPKAADSN